MGWRFVGIRLASSLVLPPLCASIVWAMMEAWSLVR
jgi:hypothetical protein